MGLLRNIKKLYMDVVTDEPRRLKLQYRGVYLLLAAVSCVMSIVNIIAGMHPALTWSTVIFTVLCLLNFLMSRMGGRAELAARVIFQTEIILLLTFFVVSGLPEGFSACWAVMLPGSGLLLFKKKRGTLLSAIMFCILVFFFWTPFGRSLLFYSYTQAFMLRFPLLYIAVYALGFTFESLREMTEEKYIYLYNHDYLTDALSRSGFASVTDEVMNSQDGKYLVFILFDLDFFKNVNDTLGHVAGDKVLVEAAGILKSITGMKVCRWGGEEFAVMFAADSFSYEQAERMCRDFEDRTITVDGKPVDITVSLGAFAAPRAAGLSLDRMIARADACLYRAKDEGRNRAVVEYYGTEEQNAAL